MDNGLLKMQREYDRHRNNFLMDLENSYLHDWDSTLEPHPTGPRRFEHPRWGAVMRRACEHSDVTFGEYVQ